MKKLAMTLVTAMLAMAMMTGCGTKEEVKTEEAAATTEETVVTEEATVEETATEEAVAVGTSKEGVMVMGFDASFPPYGYTDDNGEYVGFDIDLAKEVAARLGVELELQPIDWDAKDMELSAGTIDCIWNGFTINGREDDYTWSDPYVDNSQVFVVTKESGIATHADLAGKTVTVQAGSSALAALESEDGLALKDSFKELVEVADYNTAFMNLEAGACEAVAMDIGVADFQMESRDGEYVILEEALASEMYGIGFLLGNETLRDNVQAKLNEMAEDGTFMEIATTWELQDSVTLGK